MPNCMYEQWTLRDLATAISKRQNGKKEIVVPMFQRGKRWTKDKEDNFVDSLEKGYPVGTMLFFRSVDGQKEIYTLIDGLQRANTVRNYLLNPTLYVVARKIPSNIVDDILAVLALSGHEAAIRVKIQEVIIKEIQASATLQKIQCHIIARSITRAIPTTTNDADYLIANVLQPYVEEISERFEEIAGRTIPVIVYSGDESTLPYIFDRINSEGVPLTQYEVFAASWPQQRVICCKNRDIVNYVIKKYDALDEDDYSVKGFNREEMQKEGRLSIFEIVFGFSKFIVDKFNSLKVTKKLTSDEIEPLGFELMNACLNKSKEDVRTLYTKLMEFDDINVFIDRLIESINYVEATLSKVMRFKGNKRTENTSLHSKYQIISMIALVFLEKYSIEDLTRARKTWKESKAKLDCYLIQHYVLDIISSEWNEGGTTRIFTILSTQRYLYPVSGHALNNALNSYFLKQSYRLESKNVATPSKEDIIILNSIYTEIFTAADQLSSCVFDIEHIAPKDQIKDIIHKSGSKGLPISSIANLCYLPQKLNRGKGKKTIYQGLYSPVELQDIEAKYCFTNEQSLEWINVRYRADDHAFLKESYHDYLKQRFVVQKQKLFKALNVEYKDSYNDTSVVLD